MPLVELSGADGVGTGGGPERSAWLLSGASGCSEAMLPHFRTLGNRGRQISVTRRSVPEIPESRVDSQNGPKSTVGGRFSLSSSIVRRLGGGPYWDSWSSVRSLGGGPYWDSWSSVRSLGGGAILDVESGTVGTTKHYPALDQARLGRAWRKES